MVDRGYTTLTQTENRHPTELNNLGPPAHFFASRLCHLYASRVYHEFGM